MTRASSSRSADWALEPLLPPPLSGIPKGPEGVAGPVIPSGVRPFFFETALPLRWWRSHRYRPHGAVIAPVAQLGLNGAYGFSCGPLAVCGRLRCGLKDADDQNIDSKQDYTAHGSDVFGP